MYGLIGKIDVTAGNRDQLIDILLSCTQEMPGCKLYAIAADTEDDNGIWVTEIWDDEDSYHASLKLPEVQQAMANGRPLIAGFGARHIVTPMGGFGVAL